MPILLILILLPSLLVTIEFIKFALTGNRLYHIVYTRILEFVSLVILPYLYLSAMDQDANDCCNDSATFAYDHKLTIYIYIFICLLAFLYSLWKETISSPIIEVVINAILLMAIVFNVFIAIQVEPYIWLFGNLPIIEVFIMRLMDNQKRLILHMEGNEITYRNSMEKLAWKILKLNPLIKIPILFILCLPIIAIITALLLLFGQKPDSMIRAFTETYKHGFSQWDYQCDNVQCGGHYLCSVAANGHPNVVKPQRMGIRNGNPIICNRQLLISNAFEDLLQEKMPSLHRLIRKQYNKVGNFIHRYYTIFNIKIFADLIYILMKPLEWLFLIILYTFDHKPENRIAKQYLSLADRQKIDYLKKNK